MYLFKESKKIKGEYDKSLKSDYEKVIRIKRIKETFLLLILQIIWEGFLREYFQKAVIVHIKSRHPKKHLNKNKIDLIISDWYLKDTTGTELFLFNHSPGNRGPIYTNEL